jgi:HAMP domain-containing protein
MTPATATPEANDEVQNLQKELDRLRHELVARARREDGEVRP